MMERATMATSFPKDQIKFLLLENVHQSAHDLIRNEGFALEAVPRSLKEDELAQKLRDVHVLGIRSKTQVTARALAEARRLLSVGCFCIGTNQVDLAAANGRGVPVFNAPFSNTRSVAELMIGASELALMRAGSYLLNASRGSVVDLPALAEALRSGHLSGASVDVYPDEPESNSDGFATPLRGLPNVLLTPHVAGSTIEAQEAIGREGATSLIKFVNAGATTGAVNFPQVELPQAKGAHRILNAHHNVPGVLRDINRIVSEKGANIQAQVLATDPNIGYLVMDMDQDVSSDVKKAIAALPTSIKTRILY